jgi:tRNA dimethylallyltransferase
VIILTGPTASGKSAVGLELASSLGAEILSVDSMKVYRRMDIGTAKPTSADRARVPHHLIDLREPWESYTVHDYVRDADRAAADVASRGGRVLMEGGTPLYIKAFLEGLFEGPPPDEELRARLGAEAKERGLGELHARLARVDPVAAGRIHPNDERRIVRALEVHEQTGVPISSLQTQSGATRPGVRARLFALERPKEEIRARISARIDRMLDLGFLEEARALLDVKPALGAVGYRELWAHLEGEISLDEARGRIRTETWRFVRRQLTWLRSFQDVVWFAGGADPARDAGRIEEELASERDAGG